MDWGQTAVVPCNEAEFVGKETIHVYLNNTVNWKIREPTCHFNGKVKHENFIPGSIVSDIVESFSHIKKSNHYMFSSAETFHNGLRKSEEIIINRLILSETWLILTYETYVFWIGV